MNKVIEIDGEQYELVPLRGEKFDEDIVTYYSGADSDCGFFKFTILLNDDGSLCKGTESVTYYPKGQRDMNNTECWDNTDFLTNILDNPTNEVVCNTKEFLGNPHNVGEFRYLLALLMSLRGLGWL